MIFDTHAHYDDEAFDEDRETLLNTLEEKGIGIVVNVGASMESTKDSVELAHKYEFIYAAVGVHPNETGKLTVDDMNKLEEYSKDNKVVAIGEIGLDYHFIEPDKEIQMHWFRKQLEMAREYVKMGYYIGIGGVLTFKNSKKLKEAALDIPLERIVLETDCPYLSPEPFRGKRNSSDKLEYVVKTLSEIKGISEEDIIKETYKNAVNMYGGLDGIIRNT